MPTSAGYSQTPLAKKLGIKEGHKVAVINAPNSYFELFTDFPKHVIVLDDPKVKKNCIHYFCKSVTQLEQEIPLLRLQIEQDGMIWISWPKKVSKVPTDITEDVVRKIALNNDLVDIKVCAIDTIWSGLKLVIPVKRRTKDDKK